MSTPLLHEELADAVARLGALLRALTLAAGADPGKPQEVHRRFGIDRVLCWKISRIVKAASAEDALRQLPGEESFAIFIRAAERAGAPAADARQALEAAQALYKAIDTHVGDRPTLELLLDSVPRGSDGLLVSRKLAFRGASGIWGVQARSRTQLILLAPGAGTPESLDCAVVAGWEDFRRLRLDVPWRLFRHRVSPEADADGLLPEFCSNLPDLTPVRDGAYLHYELGPSRLGSAGAFTAFCAFMRHNHGHRFSRRPQDELEFSVSILAPVESVVIDLLVHRSLDLLQGAQVQLRSGAFNDGLRRQDGALLPIEALREELGSPPRVDGTHASRLPELAERMFRRGGWDVMDFVGTRFRLEFPPFPSVVWLSCTLPAPP
jgi:hypothetical protein